MTRLGCRNAFACITHCCAKQDHKKHTGIFVPHTFHMLDDKTHTPWPPSNNTHTPHPPPVNIASTVTLCAWTSPRNLKWPWTPLETAGCPLWLVETSPRQRLELLQHPRHIILNPNLKKKTIETKSSFTKGWLAGWLAERHAAGLASWPASWPAGWLADRLGS